MSKSKRSQEGSILIDHRASPGVAPEMSRYTNLPDGAGRGIFESPTFTCSHCQRVVVMNPARTRSRGYCRKCDHYVCDNCEAKRVKSGGVCYTYKQYIDDISEEIVKIEARTGEKHDGQGIILSNNVYANGDR
jgi:hypothetical protein